MLDPRIPLCKSPHSLFLIICVTAMVSAGVLHLLQLSDAPWINLKEPQQRPSNGSSALEQCMQQQAAVPICDLPGRSRQLQHGVTSHLAVSRSRGLASLVTDMQHLLLMDLEEDEEQGDEDADGMQEE